MGCSKISVQVARPQILNLDTTKCSITQDCGRHCSLNHQRLEKNLICFSDNSRLLGKSPGAGRRLYTKGGDTAECSVPSNDVAVISTWEAEEAEAGGSP